ncbi:hypothetical protein PR202_ga07169 [Eleusine coracana subsp. coracana]|uniref:3-hydroxyacyl-CoA dehydrogenase NAD binding domain-containing protein n=1 Tax=Eleusine coracana subsp. coracana TaxID=191504 RepID=A0AAV5C024_ELECO|nr:hypothetical protein PR202_ga07169 [Eleusine coracana subsp. coracana]
MAAGSAIRVTMEVGADGVALITICNPPVNALHPRIFDGLKEKYTEAMARDDVKAIVLTGSGGIFCGGFDINMFSQCWPAGNISLLPSVSVDLVSNIMEGAKSLRLLPFKALLSVVDLSWLWLVMLGYLPLNLNSGTQRLPRLVGLPKAIEMMLQSKFITAKDAKECGLVDAIFSPDELIKMARLWALEIANCRKPWIRSLARTDRLGSLSEARAVLSTARQQVKKVAPHLPQQQACLDVIEEGVLFGGHAGVLKEEKVFNELVLSPTSRALVHIFFAQRSTTKVPGVTDIQLKPRQIRKVAVIGGGLMGSGIATALLVGNISVVLKEVNSQFLERGQKMIAANLEGLVKRRTLTKDKMNKALSLLKGALDYSDFKDVDMVIEAVIEKIPLKQSIFADIEKICPPHCILATNTSTIDLNIVGEKTNSQDRIIGAHFFSPAHIMPLLEIVRTEKTSPQAILDLITVGKIIKKVPVVVGNCTGFAVNRKSNGKGYYIYEKGGKPKPDPSVQNVIEEYRKRAKAMPGGKPVTLTDQDILEMIFFPVVNEACRVMDENVVIRASDLDIASVLGMGFPKYR